MSSFARKRLYDSTRKLHTPTDDMNSNSNSNVKVIVRIRPENKAEAGGNFATVVVPMNENILSFDPDENSSPDYTVFKPKRPRRDVCQRRHKDLKFGFDRVFGPDSSTMSVYENTTKEILDGLLDGYNCSVFAYGATGAGKTYTMLGSKTDPGVMYLTMIDLYQRIADMKSEKTCEVAVSYLEVYNEQIRDLLMPSPRFLPIREDSRGVVVPGLSLHKPNTAEELLYMLQFGNENRSQHPTDANAESSRSHAVFQVFVRQKDRTANISAEVKVAKLCLVDLAGSERATVTKNRGKRFREGANINRSLLALGNVINALADNKSKGHIPYRDSKLTRLLKDSLGGNCRTVMIAAVSPSFMTFEDTYNTLKYADRAKNIKTTLKKNILSVDFHVSRYGQIVEDLRREIVELKEKLKKCESSGASSTSVSVPVPDVITSYRDTLNTIYSGRMRLRQEQMEYESLDRELQFKKHRKGKLLQRILLLGELEHKARSDKIYKSIQTAQSQLVGLQTKKEDVGVRYRENDEKMTKFYSSICKSEGENIVHEMLDLHIKAHNLMVEISDARQQIKHLKKLIKIQEKESQSNDKLLTSVLTLVKKQFYILKGQGLATSDIINHYQSVCKMVEGCEVSWADDVGHKNSENQFSLRNVTSLPLLSSQTADVQTPKSSIKHRLTPVSAKRLNCASGNIDASQDQSQVQMSYAEILKSPATSSKNPIPKIKNAKHNDRTVPNRDTTFTIQPKKIGQNDDNVLCKFPLNNETTYTINKEVQKPEKVHHLNNTFTLESQISRNNIQPVKNDVKQSVCVKQHGGDLPNDGEINTTVILNKPPVLTRLHSKNDVKQIVCVKDSPVKQNGKGLADSEINTTVTLNKPSVLTRLHSKNDVKQIVCVKDSPVKQNGKGLADSEINTTVTLNKPSVLTRLHSKNDVKQIVCVKDSPVKQNGTDLADSEINTTVTLNKPSVLTTPHSSQIVHTVPSSPFLSHTITKSAPSLTLNLPSVPNSNMKISRSGPTHSVSDLQSPFISLSTMSKPNNTSSTGENTNRLGLCSVGLKTSVSDYISPLKNIVIPNSLRKSAAKDSVKNTQELMHVHHDHTEGKAAKRSIHFEDNVIPDTPNKDIVKTASPVIRTPLKLINQDTASPLAAPLMSPDNNSRPINKKTVNFEIHKQQSHRKLRSPVVRSAEKKKDAPLPRYQQMTTSSSIRSKMNYARVQVNKENVVPAQRQVAKKETNGPTFSRKLTKSKSTSSLSRFGWQNR